MQQFIGPEKLVNSSIKWSFIVFGCGSHLSFKQSDSAKCITQLEHNYRWCNRSICQISSGLEIPQVTHDIVLVSKQRTRFSALQEVSN